MTDEDLVLHVRHIRAAKICMSGARQWGARYNLDWNEFVKNGIPLRNLDHITDALKDRIVEQARLEKDHGR